MNKQKFIKIVKNYNNISEEDRNKLHEIVKAYPYSQILHTLIAKANHDAKTSIAGQTLNYAAMYATDRAILKHVIQSQPVIPEQPIVSEPESIAAEEHEPAVVVTEKERFTATYSNEDSVSDELRDKVLGDLEALKKSKESYLEWEAEHPEKKVVKRKAVRKTTKKTTAAETKATPKKAKSTTASAKTATKKKAALAKKETKPKATTKTKKTTTKKKSTSEDKTISAERTPQEEQNKLIEQFISAEPKIKAKPKASSEPQEDLSENSTHFNDDLVSENLAKILISQGKKDKAIDIYKKLIWKFPQKKSYFATQIKDLQK
ncbi:tetratricopeptide repeat protein [Fulvivirga ligni]|uniref:tetratricopeptide repeat protein n=1 Tax=Fulvivirga ligni TaxID=2904246 RepID=UPI001F2A7E13|nr:tetratricopeptide repeat protein [Fulvivirga ligni]UII24066.1 hypothetical protein LVD16_12640 [Fulvivirga ligni]